MSLNNVILRAVCLTLFIVAVFFAGCSNKGNKSSNQEIKYTAYYFHPTARCESCLNLEAFLKELIETKFKDKGVVFREVNIEEKANEHYKKDYSLKFSSVIVSKNEYGKESAWINLDSVWSYTGSKKNFFAYSEREINRFINNNSK